MTQYESRRDHAFPAGWDSDAADSSEEDLDRDNPSSGWIASALSTLQDMRSHLVQIEKEQIFRKLPTAQPQSAWVNSVQQVLQLSPGALPLLLLWWSMFDDRLLSDHLHSLQAMIELQGEDPMHMVPPRVLQQYKLFQRVSTLKRYLLWLGLVSILGSWLITPIAGWLTPLGTIALSCSIFFNAILRMHLCVDTHDNEEAKDETARAELRKVTWSHLLRFLSLFLFSTLLFLSTVSHNPWLTRVLPSLLPGLSIVMSLVAAVMNLLHAYRAQNRDERRAYLKLAAFQGAVVSLMLLGMIFPHFAVSSMLALSLLFTVPKLPEAYASLTHHARNIWYRISHCCRRPPTPREHLP